MRKKKREREQLIFRKHVMACQKREREREREREENERGNGCFFIKKCTCKYQYFCTGEATLAHVKNKGKYSRAI